MADSLLARFERSLGAIVHRTLFRLRELVTPAAVESGIRALGVGGGLAVVPFAGLRPAIETALVAHLTDAATASGDRVQVHGQQLHLRDRSAEWAARHGAATVAAVDAGTRAAIRGVIDRALRADRPPREAAAAVRELIGLTDRQARAVESYRTGLVAQGLGPSRVDRLATVYRDRLVRYRAQTIARTEMSLAINRGTQEAWRAGVAAGGLPPTLRRRWVTADDERVCGFCGPLDGAIVGLEEPFVGGGRRPMALLLPPAHPRCRCSLASA